MIDLDLSMTEIVDGDDGGVASGMEGRTVGAGAGAFKRRGSPSEGAQEKAVVFEIREGGTLEDDDEVKHYDADGMCASCRVFWICVDRTSAFHFVVSIDEGSCIRWHWHDCHCDRACDVRGARMGCLTWRSVQLTVFYIKFVV
jgi:hypothetical protein